MTIQDSKVLTSDSIVYILSLVSPHIWGKAQRDYTIVWETARLLTHKGYVFSKASSLILILF